MLRYTLSFLVRRGLGNSIQCSRALTESGKINSEALAQNERNQPAKKHANPFARGKTLDESTSLQQDNSGAHMSPAEKEKRLKVLQLEVDMANQEGRRVPSLDFFNDDHWEHVLALPSKSARMKYYGFLWQIEMKKLAKQRKKEEKAIETQERLEKLREERAQNDHIIYGLGHVSMFLRVYDTTINHWMNHR